MEEIVFGRRYRALEKIGTGGMADVFKAVDEVLGRTVAVKVMHPRYAADPSFAARFRQEAQSAANLVSPNIVNMYDWGADGDTYYIVMEYVRGNDLKSIILQKGALSTEKVANIGAQVCSALSVAHGYDIIHRDIKPHNIMVQPDGSVKVMDFGIARAGNSTMTQTGSVLGTAHYVSPEQAQGKELQATSDLYSLGIVLYEAATGHLPFDADTPVAVALKQVNEQPKPPRTINPDIDPALEAIIVKAMQKNPAQRYTSAEDMRRDLLAVAHGQSPANTGMIAGVAGAAAATQMLPMSDQTSVLPTVGNGNQYDQQVRRQMAPKKKPIWPWILVGVLLLLAGLGAAYGMGAFGNGSVQVPDLTGLSQAEATVALQSAGLVPGQATRAYSDTIGTGKIISQDPPKGTSTSKGTTVSFVLSDGAQPFPIPNVVGMSDTEAVKALQDAGFIPVSGGSQYDKSAPIGQVLSQTPAAGEQAAKGSQVTYVTSKGTQLTSVPDVTNMTKSAAEDALVAAGFKYSTSSEFSENTDAGKVISQSPSAGGSYPPKTVIKLLISEGPAVVVPNLFNKSYGDAKQVLDGLGLVISPASSSSDTATVTAQKPAKGAKVKSGSTVTVTLTTTP